MNLTGRWMCTEIITMRCDEGKPLTIAPPVLLLGLCSCCFVLNPKAFIPFPSKPYIFLRVGSFLKTFWPPAFSESLQDLVPLKWYLGCIRRDGWLFGDYIGENITQECAPQDSRGVLRGKKSAAGSLIGWHKNLLHPQHLSPYIAEATFNSRP